MNDDRRKSFRKPEKRAGPYKSGALARKPAQAAGGDAPERIAKRLARAGVASRREAEAMIAAGRVAVNGKVIDSPALNVSGSDRIEVDGAPIPEIERTRLFLYHKPAGLVTTNRDPQGRPTVFDALPRDLPRLVTVGRLDINTEGLLLLTNDGGLSRVLELPSTGWLRRYRVRVHGKVDEKALADLKDGIAVDGVFYGAVEASLERVQGSNAWLSIGLREGKNREVKNILASLGLDVTRLIRVSYGPFQLADLAEGEVRELRGRMLRDQLGPRLIEQAGADFEAPVVSQRKAEPHADKPERRGAPPAGDRRDRRDGAHDAALSRLTTKEPGRDKSDAKGDGKPRGSLEPRSRASNVWMAPGARPRGPKAASAASAKTPLADPKRRAGKKAGADPAKPKAGAGGKPARPGKPSSAGKRFDKGGAADKGGRKNHPGGRPDADRRR
jgi:23S rRNA pseudouridine2605 synthase